MPGLRSVRIPRPCTMLLLAHMTWGLFGWAVFGSGPTWLPFCWGVWIRERWLTLYGLWLLIFMHQSLWSIGSRLHRRCKRQTSSPRRLPTYAGVDGIPDTANHKLSTPDPSRQDPVGQDAALGQPPARPDSVSPSDGNTELFFDRGACVLIRIRPHLGEGGGRPLLEAPYGSSNKLHRTLKGGQTKEYTFDHIFDPSARSGVIFARIRSLIDGFTQGANPGVLVVDGHSGTGKSYTMCVDGEALIPRIASHIFEQIRLLEASGSEAVLKCSIGEVYKGAGKDLLQRGKAKVTPALPRPDRSTPFRQERVSSASNLADLFRRAYQTRVTARTEHNPGSSRGHLVGTLILSKKGSSSGCEVSSQLFLVDLAGAERLSGNQTPEEAEVTRAIIKSREQFRTVLNQYMTSKNGQVYGGGSCKLTMLLRDAFVPTGRFAVIAHVSPEAKDDRATAATLDYAEQLHNAVLSMRKRS